MSNKEFFELGLFWIIIALTVMYSFIGLYILSLILLVVAILLLESTSRKKRRK